MIYSFAVRITGSFEKKGYLPSEESEVIAYGLFSLMSKLFYAVICVLLGVLFQCVFESIVFYLAFLFLKKYAGGYHAPTEGKCMIISTCSILLSVCCIHFCVSFPVLAKANFLIALAASALVVLFSPVEAEEKKLSEEEKKKYRVYSVIRNAVLLIAAGVLLFTPYKNAGTAISTAVLLEVLLLSAGKIKQLRKKTSVDVQ